MPPALPEEAFLPKRPFSKGERLAFITRRNRMFSLCTSAEQQCLTELAHWYATVRLELFAKPNLFTKSYAAWFKHRYLSWANPKRHPIVLGLSKVSRLISKVDRWLVLRAQVNFITRIQSLAKKDDADRLVAVIQFIRMLPLEVSFEEKNAFEKRLDTLMGECLANRRVSAVKRFDAVRRCATWAYEIDGPWANDAILRKHAWSLLLDVAQEDMESAVHLIDEHWKQTRSPQILMTLNLHERSELAYRLAVKLKPHRADFAADMLCVLLFDTSFQVKKVDQATAQVLEKIIAASCQLLAQWTLEKSWTSPQNALLSIDHLLQFGDPQADYWSKLAPEGLAILKGLAPKELDQQLRQLAPVVFYGENSARGGEAFELFKGCIERKLSVQGDWEWTLGLIIDEVSQSLTILEDKVKSRRNRHIAAHPNHPLLHAFEMQLQVFLSRLLTAEPASALTHIASLTLALSDEILIRKHHRIFRDEFELRARKYPADAGLALKKMIQHCYYTQMNDEMYRKELCQASFDALLPLLACISPADAAVARSGIGWNPRYGI